MDNKIKSKENINFISKNEKIKNGTQSSILNYFKSIQNIDSINQNINNNKSKKEEHIINFNFENIKGRENNKKRKDITSPNINKIQKEKNDTLNINIVDKMKLKDNKINNIEMHNPNKINKIKNDKIKYKNNLEEKPNISQISKKNFNETLFDYKQYSLINNNPIKKKYEFEKELKKTKKLKDMSMKKKKKLWIKIDLLEKEKENSELPNEKKICLSKPNQKSKIINLNSINEESSYKKGSQEYDFEAESTEKNDDDYNVNLTGNYFNYNKKIKKSQDDFDIDLVNKKSFDNESDIFIGKYKQYLKNKNSKKNKDFKKIRQNCESKSSFKFLDGFIPFS